MSTIRTILEDRQKLGIKDVVFIADRGYPSEENLAVLVQAGIPFLMCAKTGSAPVAQLLKNVEFDKDGFPTNMCYDEKRRLYCMQVDVPEYKATLADGTEVEMNGLKANLFLNPRRRADEIGALKRKILDKQSSLDWKIAEEFVPKDIKAFNALYQYFKVAWRTSEDGKPSGIGYSPNSTKSEKELSQCGFFSSIMFKMDLGAEEALDVYKSRDEHEKNFDQLKNQMLCYNQKSSNEDSRNCKAFISFVGLITISAVRQAWKEKMRDRFDSLLDMLDELESIRFSEYTDGTSHMTTFTVRQVEICDACKVKVPKECMSASIRKAKQRAGKPKNRDRNSKSKMINIV